ncbi:J domain-containing protein [Thermoplasmatales archaeon AK]|nr:J domain-containing protein [Thermoplasmatales archaeon AK]
MESIPLSEFPEAGLNFFNRNGEVKFRYALGDAGSNHVEQFVYSYFITPSSKLGSTWNVRGAAVGAFPTVYDKKITIHNIEWKFSRAVPGEMDLLLVYISGNGHISRSELVVDFSSRRDLIIAALRPLLSAARHFGMPGDGAPVTYVYTGEEYKKPGSVGSQRPSGIDRYFRILGLVPTTNIGLVRAAYRELVKQYHPDTNTGISEARMKEINEAYEKIIAAIRDEGEMQR